MERTCKNCGKSLPEELHQSKRYCAKLDKFGNIITGDSWCKIKFNNGKKKMRNADLVSWLAYHKNAASQLSRLYHEGRRTITDDELKKLGIYTTINLAIKIEVDWSELIVFRGYALRPFKDNKKHFKIQQYDNSQIF